MNSKRRNLINRACIAILSLLLLGLQTDIPTQPVQRLDPMIQKIVSEVSTERIAEILKKLESFETRNTLSDPNQPKRGIGAARQWIHDQLKSYDAVLRWEHPNPEPDLAGYIIVIRSTQAPDWEREIWAGNLQEFTIKNVPIDELVFGVKSVDREGHESPVSAYVIRQPSWR
jgi:hypothetical protein